MPLFDIGQISLSGNYLTWKINNFFSLSLSEGCEICSEQFVYGDSRYGLNLWPQGRKGSGNQEWFGICLYKYDSPGTVDSVQFSIFTASGNIKTCTVACSEHNLYREERFMEWSDFCTLSHKIAPLGCLTIVCRLPNRNGLRSYKENDNSTKTFNQPLNSAPVKYQSGDHHSPDPLSTLSSFKLRSLETQISSFETPGNDYGHPSTINSFFSSSIFENSSEFMPESTETQYSKFKMPFDVAETATVSKDKNICTPNPARISEKKKPQSVMDPSEFSLQNEFSESVCDTTKHLSSNSTGKPSCSTSGFKGAASSCPRPRTAVSEELSTPAAVRCSKGSDMLNQQLKHLYLDGEDFDLTIVMDGREFKVHKAILKARSPTFRRMLSGDNCRDTVIPLNPFGSCDSSVFHEFLLYLYSGTIEIAPLKYILGLYHAACKFEMPYLKEECIDIFKTSLSIDTISDVFRLVNEESELVDEAVCFLARNLEVSLETDTWKQFTREEPDRAIAFPLKALKIGYKKTIV